VGIQDLSDAGLAYAARYYYTFNASNGLSVTVLRGDGPPTITDGIGGWQLIPRRRRRALTSWTGRNPLAMDIPVLFDGNGESPFSIDPDVEVLRQMAVGDNFIEPPTVQVIGVLPARGVVWVINAIEFGTDNVLYIQDPSSGDDIRVRQDATVSLIQHVQEDVVTVANSNPLPSQWKVQPGDTLRSIAKQVYGNGDKWTLISDANSGVVRSPTADLKDGITLRIPPVTAGTPVKPPRTTGGV
jgi:LysM repeat protein